MQLKNRLLPLLFLPAAVLASLVLISQVWASVDLLYFRARAEPDLIVLEWETATELDNLGFNLYRNDTGCGDTPPMNGTLIPSKVLGQPIGATYAYTDTQVTAGTLYHYWLEDVDFYNNPGCNGPVQAAVTGGQPIPTQPTQDANTPAPTQTRTPSPSPTPSSTATNQPTSTPTASRPATTGATPTNDPLPSPTLASTQVGQFTPTSVPGDSPATSEPTATATVQIAILEAAGESTAIVPVSADTGETGATVDEPGDNSQDREELALAPSDVQSIAANRLGQESAAGSTEVRLGAEPGRFRTAAIMAILAGVVLVLGGGFTTYLLIKSRQAK